MIRRLDTLIKIKRVALRQAEHQLRQATAARVDAHELARRIASASVTLDPTPGQGLAHLLGAKLELAGRVRAAGQSAAERLAQARLTAQATHAEHAAARRRLDMIIEKAAQARRTDAQIRARRAPTTKGAL